jgi:hypothetical protein
MTDSQPETTAQPPIQKPWQFNAESSRKAAQLAVAARREKAERIRNEPPKPPTPSVETVKPESIDDFTTRRLTRVREQLERLDRMAAEEDDPKRIKELADATTRLSEQERILDGRPMPGSRRPPTDKAQRAGAWCELQPALPQVAPVAAVAPVQSPAQVQPVKPMGWEYDEPNSV